MALDAYWIAEGKGIGICCERKGGRRESTICLSTCNRRQRRFEHIHHRCLDEAAPRRAAANMPSERCDNVLDVIHHGNALYRTTPIHHAL